MLISLKSPSLKTRQKCVSVAVNEWDNKSTLLESTVMKEIAKYCHKNCGVSIEQLLKKVK